MGLAGAKKDTRIGADPRNTKWLLSSSNVGHKLLSLQGWKAGEGLGGSVAGRTANVKHTYKDDLAGIGCSVTHAQEWSGLSAFNDIFVRMNSGASTPAAEEAGGVGRTTFVDVTTHKGVRGEGLAARFVLGETYTSEMSQRKFLKALGAAGATVTKASKKDKKDKKDKKVSTADESDTSERAETKEERRQRRAERKARKEAKRAASTLVSEESGDTRESKKRRRKEEGDVKTKEKKEKNKSSKDKSERDGKSKKRRKEQDSEDTPIPSGVDSGAATPIAVAVAAPAARAAPVHGRFAHRAKFQRAKQGSRLDAAQLAEILGVKA